MTHRKPIALLASVMTLGGLSVACSHSDSGHSAPASSALPASSSSAVTIPPNPTTAATHACNTFSAQAQLVGISEKDFMDGFYGNAPDVDAKREAFITASTSADQQISLALTSAVPDPPAGALHAFIDKSRAYTNVLQAQGRNVTDWSSAQEAQRAGIAAQQACQPFLPPQ
jgi:hypothetical protein